MQLTYDKASVPATKLMPILGLTFYAYEGDDSGEARYATLHPLHLENGRTVAEAGKPLTEQSVKQLHVLLSGMTGYMPEVLPGNVLAASEDLLVWWRRAGSEFLTFDVSMTGNGKERLQGVTLPMALPPLVFMLRRGGGQRGNVYVYALDTDERPCGDTTLFRAPLLNVYDSGQVCWGSAKAPAKDDVASIAQWESLFFSSAFTHVNHSSPIKSDEPYEWIADFCASKAKTFPVDMLKPMRLTLSRAVASHFEKANR